MTHPAMTAFLTPRLLPRVSRKPSLHHDRASSVSAKAIIRRLLTRSRRCALIVLAAATYPGAAVAQMQSLSDAWRPDESLEVYAVSINYPKPFDRPYTLYGVYLGHGAVLTAAHVVGRRDLLVNPMVRVAAHDVSAKVLRKGSFEQNDLALLFVDETRVPLKLRMRRNMQLCATIPKIGTNVVIAYPDRTVRSRIISPILIGNVAERKKFN